jgi:hypothetical protein
VQVRRTAPDLACSADLITAVEMIEAASSNA